MKQTTRLFLCVIVMVTVGFAAASSLMGQTKTPSVTSAEGLLKRVVPALAGKVRFEEIPAESGLDVFELQSDGGNLVIRGNNGVSMASGLNWYLKHYCNCQITHRSRQINLPVNLPVIAEKVRIVSPHQYRYYFNYCCFSYTLAFWDWNDWERMIDLMALYGVNAPLSVTGQEGVWRNVAKRIGLSEEDLQEFFVGAAFLPFGWMGCMDGWAGPLPNEWIDEHIELQQKILKRERELGMTPILQGFTGHAPAKLPTAVPGVEMVKLTPWCNFPSTWFIDPMDPYFVEFGKIFVEEQTKLFGTNHFYASDTFIEMPPSNNDPAFLKSMGASIYESMRSADPDAIWVLQGWIFINAPQFWKQPQREAFLRSVPQDKLLLLDLHCEINPAWSKTDAFCGQPWVWSIIQNFGGTVSLHGAIDNMANDLSKAIQQRGKESGKLSGVGYIMEGLGWNPLIDEFQSDMIWRESIPDTSEWIAGFVNRRYGKDNAAAQEAWKLLHQSVYQRPGRTDFPLTQRPGFSLGIRKLEYELIPAWEKLLEASDDFGNLETYRFDLVNVSREALASLTSLYYLQMIDAFQKKDRAAIKAAADGMDALILDIDRLLGTHDEFLLGSWLERSKAWGRTEEQRKLYEWNARYILTLWGPEPEKTWLDNYAIRQWAGMLSDYIRPRWQTFYRQLDMSLETGGPLDNAKLDILLRNQQSEWTHQTNRFTTRAEGNTVRISKILLEKYKPEFSSQSDLHEFLQEMGQPLKKYDPNDYPPVTSLTTGKPVTCSAQLAPYPPALANDGVRNNPNSYWACNAGNDGSAWWQVDLEKPEEVARVTVVCYYGDVRYYGFTVEGSPDGQNWTMLSDMRHNFRRSTIDGYDCRFEPQTIRYLRVTQTSNSANIGRHLVEVMAFGKE
ncbi:MAG: alpha-N-acetylglucosaminidase C-terminal domain-containing protein [Planctomycetaceae bacterium]|nr:alpha-N-acetylglucosaminidase C-terminal domain-containing protein [Planctomycetaceae bacterium]